MLEWKARATSIEEKGWRCAVGAVSKKGRRVRNWLQARNDGCSPSGDSHYNGKPALSFKDIQMS